MTPSSARPLLEAGDILRAHGAAYSARYPVSAAQAAVLRHLAACRTAALGGHVDACDGCGYTRMAYNSCRDRHCPKCQGAKRAAWLEARLQQPRLTREAAVQADLFEGDIRQRQEALDETIDRIRDEFGTPAICRGSLHLPGGASGAVGQRVIPLYLSPPASAPGPMPLTVRQ